MEMQLIPYESVRKIEGTRILVLAPHPDDEVFGCAGAIMRHVAAGDSVRVAVVTDGDYRADEALRAALGAARRQESRDAAAILGYGKPDFWGLPDRGVHYGEPLVQRIREAIVSCDADLVYAPSIHEIHPDHRALGMAAVEAVRRRGASTRLAMYEVGVAMVRPNVLLDISELAQDKQRAMACFHSQLKEQAYDQHIGALNCFRTYTLGPQISAAEAYFLSPGDTLHEQLQALYAPEYRRPQESAPFSLSTDTPLVSVLIRSMDRALLREALDSLALQTYASIEVVVVNARREEHRPLGACCGRFPLRMVGSGAPLNRSAAANFAMDNARGEYLIFLDDDDWLAPSHISLLVAALQGEPQRPVAYSGVELRGADRERLDLEPFNARFDAGRLRSGNYIPINALMFSRKLVEQGLRFDEGLETYEDWDFLLQLAQRTGFTHVDEISACYRVGGGSGVGPFSSEPSKQQARARVFEKWRHRWSGEQLDEMVTALSRAALEAIADGQAQLQSASDGNRLALTGLQETLGAQERQVARVQGELEAARLDLEATRLHLEAARLDILSGRRTVAEMVAQQEQTQAQLEAQAAAHLAQHEDAAAQLAAQAATHLAQHEEAAAKTAAQISEKDRQIHLKDALLHTVFHSTSWRVSAPVRQVGRLLRGAKESARQGLRRVLGIARWPRGAPALSQGFAGEVLIDPGKNAANPLVSVIMPVYNACRVDKTFFWKALKSIEAQTYKNVELVVVDDGSTDDSRALYDEFLRLHPGFKASYHTKANGGQSSARNFGVRVCNGDYVGFIDQDDEWYEDKLDKVVPWLANQEIDLLYTDADTVDGAGEVVYKSMHRTYCFGWPHPKSMIEDILFKDIIVMPGLMTIKKQKFESVGGFDENLSGYEDDDLFLRLFEVCKMFYLPIPTLRWRMYGDNYSFSHRMLRSRTYYWKKLLKNHTNNGTNVFRVRMISLRFFQEFLTQSMIQFNAGSELYRDSLASAREIVPYLPKFQRLLFSVGFALPQRYAMQTMVRISNYFRAG